MAGVIQHSPGAVGLGRRPPIGGIVQLGYATVILLRGMQAEAPSVAAEILLLAGIEAEVSLVKAAAQTNRVNVVEGCDLVLSYLRKQEGFADSPRPDLILLDLDLSDAVHCSMLKELKKDAGLKTIPAIVLTSGDSPALMHLAYELNANACVIKPSDPERFVQVIRGTLNFWLNLARLPRN